MKRSRFRLSLTVKAIYDEDLYRGLSLRKLQYIGNDMVELREAEGLINLIQKAESMSR
mgnify:CR=1 FL=1